MFYYVVVFHLNILNRVTLKPKYITSDVPKSVVGGLACSLIRFTRQLMTDKQSPPKYRF